MSQTLAAQAFNCFRSEIQKMAQNELDSFIFKFKNLCQAGWNATLSLKSNCGKVEAHLSVELGEAFAPVTKQSKNGPSQQRRRERRAAAREAAEAHEQVDVENDVAEGAPNGLNENAENTTENGGVGIEKDTKVDITVQDEVCSDDIYIDDLVHDDTVVEEILLQAPCQEICEEDDMNEILDYNLKILGVNMIKCKMNKSESDVITSCLVTIQPTPKKIIKRLSISLRNWKLKIVP